MNKEKLKEMIENLFTMTLWCRPNDRESFSSINQYCAMVLLSIDNAFLKENIIDLASTYNIDEVFDKEDIKEYCKNNFSINEIFDIQDLKEWANENHYHHSNEY